VLDVLIDSRAVAAAVADHFFVGGWCYPRG